MNGGTLRPLIITKIQMRFQKYGCTLEQSARESARRCVNSPYPSLPANVRENIVKFRKSRAKTRVQAMKVVKLLVDLNRRKRITSYIQYNLTISPCPCPRKLQDIGGGKCVNEAALETGSRSDHITKEGPSLGSLL
ncbi:hypothetical protein COOONC_21955 [Cooperia oncophora]